MAELSNLARLSQVAGTQKQQAGTGFTNLNRLFQANQGNQLGQKVAGNIQKQVGNVQNQLGQQQQEFQTESEKNKLGNEADIAKRNEVIGRFAPSSSGAGSDVGSGRSEGAAQPTLSDTDVSDFGRFTGGQYAGPQGLKDTGSLQSTAAGLKGQVTNFSPSGTQELLRRSVGGDRYTQGQQRLDTLLMDKSQLTPVQRQASALSGDINRANLAASGQAELNKNLAQRFGEETKGQLNTGMSGIDDAVQKKLAEYSLAEGDRQAKISSIQQFQQDASKRGAGNVYGQTDTLRNLLANQGADSSQLSQLFGKGNATDVESQVGGLSQKSNAEVAALNSIFNPNNYGFGNQSGYADREDSQRLSRNLRNNAALIQKLGISENSILNKAKGNTWYRDIFGNAAAPILRADQTKVYNTLGSAGQALQSGTQEQFYKDLYTRLSNSQGAQNLTDEGVIDSQQRNNYESLSKLLGEPSSKYKTITPRIDPLTGKEMADTSRYVAGKYNLI